MPLSYTHEEHLENLDDSFLNLINAVRDYDVTMDRTEEKTFIRFELGGEQAIVISDSELELLYQCYDCYYHRFKRN